MITLHVIVTNNTSVNLITEGGGGLRNRPRIDNLIVICERSLKIKSDKTKFVSKRASAIKLKYLKYYYEVRVYKILVKKQKQAGQNMTLKQ